MSEGCEVCDRPKANRFSPHAYWQAMCFRGVENAPVGSDGYCDEKAIDWRARALATEALVTASQAAQVTQTQARIEAEERAGRLEAALVTAAALHGHAGNCASSEWQPGRDPRVAALRERYAGTLSVDFFVEHAALAPACTCWKAALTRKAAECGEAHWIGRCEHDRIIGAVCFQCPRNHARPMSTPDDPAAIRDAALEEAAKACEAVGTSHHHVTEECANAIRGLRRGGP